MGTRASLSRCPCPVGLFRASDRLCVTCARLSRPEGGPHAGVVCAPPCVRMAMPPTQAAEASRSLAAASDLLANAHSPEDPHTASGKLRKGTGWGSVTYVPLKTDPEQAWCSRSALARGSPSHGAFYWPCRRGLSVKVRRDILLSAACPELCVFSHDYIVH